MKKYALITGCILCLSLTATAQNRLYTIVTSDIDHFWTAYDSLAFAHSQQDSINIIQRDYIDKASPGLIEFLKVRPSTAKRYVKAIGLFPKFWKSLRPRTELVKDLNKKIGKIYSAYYQYLPGFRPPNVCFVIGTLSSGGTVTKGWVLIGTEIAAADSLTDTSEFTGWLKQKLGKGNAMTHIVAIVAHEMVHTQQVNPDSSTLLSIAIQEGSADFIPEQLLGLQNDKGVFAYGKQHECELWTLFQKDLKNNGPISNWFYATVKNRPADMGYFIGAQICKAYYDRMHNKKEALKDILKSTDYKKLVQESHYDGKCGLLTVIPPIKPSGKTAAKRRF